MSFGIIFTSTLLRRWECNIVKGRQNFVNDSTDFCCIETNFVKETHNKIVTVPRIVKASEQEVEHGLDRH